MTTEPITDFWPDYPIPPGLMLEEWLDEHCIKQVDLAKRLNMSPKTVNQIIRGVAPLTAETIRKLEYCTGIHAQLWTGLESRYQEKRARLAEEKCLKEDSDILDQLPMIQMRKRGIITCKPSDEVGTMREVLSFFQVADVATWHKIWTGTSTKQRVSAVEASFAGALATWLRLGEIESVAKDLAKYSPRGLNKALKQVKALDVPASRDNLLANLKGVLAEVGVGLVVVATFQGAECTHAIRWIANRPVIILSTKLKTPEKILPVIIECLEYVLAHPRTNAVIISA
jgi:HTH-type transcriptional regulator/antitoxin HigA